MNSNWEFRKLNSQQWLPATVPGTVHTDLLANRLIPDPYLGTNEKEVQWVEKEDWEYQTTFSLTAADMSRKHMELQFDGLDTYADVYLNDKLILSADNMFRTWLLDVKKQLRGGNNVLRIVFHPAVNKGKEEAAKLPYTLPGDEKVFTRKAAYQYGWDWGPRLVTCGIWKDVKLIFWDKMKIEAVQHELLQLSDTLAKLNFTFDIYSELKGKFWLKAEYNESHADVSEKNVFRTETELKPGLNHVSMFCHIPYPKKWWCNGMGSPDLYAFKLSVTGITSERNEGVEYDAKDMSIGLRTIELVQDKDSIGSSFYFKLNGIPVFIKGANYIPPDNFLPRQKDSSYYRIVENAKQANMNMLRVWGGGVYADDAFYNACDAKGILVWQDLMFACAMYPGNEAFLRNVKQEVKDQLSRLQDHPCIALWCGNNESDEGWKNWGWQKQYNYSRTDSEQIWMDYKILFTNVIPSVLGKRNIYWPSSPSIGWGHKESMYSGDAHYWGVWWGMEPFSKYKEKVPRFMTEYGFQGFPSEKVLEDCGVLKSGIVDSAALYAHEKHPIGLQTIKAYIQRDFPVPSNAEDFNYVSQLLQAEGMKVAIEAHRRAQPYCMGTLFWQLNDCWPALSWSSIDHNETWKAAMYQAKRSYAGQIISVEEKNEALSLFLISDEEQQEKGTLILRLRDYLGNMIWKKELELVVPGSSSVKVATVKLEEFGPFDKHNSFLECTFKNTKGIELKAVHYFCPPKECMLRQPMIMCKFLPGNKLEISTDVLIRNVFLSCNNVNFEDNYFDLVPGEKRVIEIQGDPGKNPGLHIKSLYDVIK